MNGAVNFSNVWQFYHPQPVITVGPMPAVTSSASGRNASALAALCAARGQQEAAAAGQPALPPQPPTASGAAAGEGGGAPREWGYLRSYIIDPSVPPAAYVVYVFGELNYGEASALYASVDFGAHWLPLSGAGATPTQGLGDSPAIIEASAAEPGVVFVGTGGRGAFWRDVSGVLESALLACEA